MQWVKSIHKWTSLFVGIQLLLWLVSGLYFNIMDHEEAKGTRYLSKEKQTLSVDKPRLMEPRTVLEKQPASQSLRLIHLLEQPYYLLTHKTGLYPHFENNYSLVNAYNGELQVIDEALATQLAKQSYNGPGAVVSATKMSPPIDDIPKEKNNVWQVNFDDEINTSVYIDAGSGRLVSHSNDDKRFVDIFFILHFMDYGVKGDFNSWQIILFGVVTLWLAVTGIIWTFQLLFSGHYRFSLKKENSTLKVMDEDHQEIGTFNPASHETIIEALAENNIGVPSSCGGGGTCGQCKIKMAPDSAITSAEQEHISKNELNAGYRLACQHKTEEISEIILDEYSHLKKHNLILTSSEFLTPFIKELRFRVEGNKALTFKAGAYMRFFIPQAEGCSRPSVLPEEYLPHWHHIEHLEFEHLSCSRSYSLANYDTQSNELVFTIKMQAAPDKESVPGIGSNYLCNLNPGDAIEAAGPFEEFFADAKSDRTMVLLGAGSGMAPLKSLVFEQLEKFRSQRKIYFYYGARSEKDLLYTDEFTELSRKYSNFNFYPVLSQPDDGWAGNRGYVQQLMESELEQIDRPGNIEFYLCGPKAMVIETIELLHGMGVKDSSIAFDDFGAN